MQRTLWLKFEHPPHPGAVTHPANADELRLVIALLKMPQAQRAQLSGQLRNWLAESQHESPFDRPGVAVRFGGGLYQPIPWRLAKWLSRVLPISESQATDTRLRIQNWLENEDRSQLLTLD